ncbi:MAG: dCTP deaminase [Candidatus Parvarchaeota archaeon]|jgi:dCTP deaminase|nr:dCTP deaminase [Candidatus Parvarchaeota archaeon]MDG7047134.1 dCTP deaminase [Nitrososphaerota archaeon]
MSVLAKDALLRSIKSKDIVIKPFNVSDVGPGSIDLHLGNDFRVFNKTHDIFKVVDNADYKNITKPVHVRNGDYLLIMPGELVHGITIERIKTSDNISGRIEGRSRFARLGLIVHLSSGFMHPGNDSRIVLEMVNMSPVPLAVYPGTAICQMIFERTEGRGKYAGRFFHQTTT